MSDYVLSEKQTITLNYIIDAYKEGLKVLIEWF